MSRSLPRPRRRICLALTLVGALNLVARPRALAQTSTADRAIAERLYDRGRTQIEQGQVAAACDSFAESQRLDAATGTLLNLAACHEAQGKLASAWVEFREAAAAARREKRPDRVRYAQDHLTAIEPRLAYLTIAVGGSTRAQPPVITLDGRALGAAAWGVAIPVDAGSHEAVAEFAPDRSWRTTVKVRDGEKRTLQIPEASALGGAPAVKTDAPPVTPAVVAVALPPPVEAGAASDNRSGRHLTAVILGAAGLAAVGVGAYYGWRASDLWSQRNRQCPMEKCTAEGVTLGERADSAATVANWTIGGGLVALGVTALLLFWPHPPSTSDSRPAHAAAGTLGGLVTDLHLAPSIPLGVGGTF